MRTIGLQGEADGGPFCLFWLSRFGTRGFILALYIVGGVSARRPGLYPVSAIGQQADGLR